MSADKQRRFYGRWTILNSSDWLTCVGWKTSADCRFEFHSSAALTASVPKGNLGEGLGLTLRWMCLWWKEISTLESILLHFAGVLALLNANTMQLFFRCAEESRLKSGEKEIQFHHSNRFSVGQVESRKTHFSLLVDDSQDMCIERMDFRRPFRRKVILLLFFAFNCDKSGASCQSERRHSPELPS